MQFINNTLHKSPTTKVMVVNLYTRVTQSSQITYNTISDPQNT